MEAAEDDAELARAHEATEEAKAAAEKADPLGDGSYAGDASKTALVDTPDLEAFDHRRNAPTLAVRSEAAEAPARADATAEGSLDRPDYTDRPDDTDRPDATDARDGDLTVEDLKAQKNAEEESRFREAHWLGIDPQQLSREDDGL